MSSYDVREDFATNKRKRPPREHNIPVMAVKNKKPHVKRTISLIRLPVNADFDLGAEAASVLWRAVNQEQDKDVSFEHYLSFLSVMLPELRNDIEICVRDSGYILAYNEFPNSMAYSDYNNIETMLLNLAQSMVYLGVSLLLPYENITSENYSGYFTRRIAALSNMVGGVDEDFSKMGTPFSVEKCIYFKARMNQFDIIRKKIIRFLISEDVKAETLFNVVARYVTQMVEWAEMTEFKFVMDALVVSASPVLFCMELASEVSKFFDIAERVFACSHPSLYRYLAAEGELIAMDESQFPILYAVAFTILSELYPSVRQLHGPSNVNSKIVQRFVALHRTYVDKTMFVTKQVERFIPDFIDPDIRHLTFQMRTYNLSAEELIRLKSFSEKGAASLDTSKVQDSHTVDKTKFVTKQVERFIPDLTDLDIRRLKLQMRTYNLSAEDLIRLKSFSEKGAASLATSKVRDSHTVDKMKFVTKQVERFIPDLIDPDIRHLAFQMRTHNLSAEDLILLKSFSERSASSLATFIGNFNSSRQPHG